MKKYITVYQNNIRLLGSDFTRVINSNLTEKGIDNRMVNFKDYINNLKNIKPFLNESELIFKIEY
jgi:hypothetical protein